MILKSVNMTTRDLGWNSLEGRFHVFHNGKLTGERSINEILDVYVKPNSRKKFHPYGHNARPHGHGWSNVSTSNSTFTLASRLTRCKSN